MVNPDLIASRDYYRETDDETLTDSPEARKPAVSGGEHGWSDDYIERDSKSEKEETDTIKKSPETRKPAVSGGSFGWSDDHETKTEQLTDSPEIHKPAVSGGDSKSKKSRKSKESEKPKGTEKSEITYESPEVRKPAVSKPEPPPEEESSILTESPEVHKAVSKPESPSDEETDFLKTSVSSKSILFESPEVRKPAVSQPGLTTFVLLESPETRKGSTYEPLEKKYSEMSYVELELEYYRVSKELEELKNHKDVSPYEWNAKVRELETILREMEKKKPLEISFLESVEDWRKIIEGWKAPSPLKSFSIGLYDAIMGIPSTVAGFVHEERARLVLPSKKETEFMLIRWESFIESGKEGLKWAKQNPADAVPYVVGFLIPVVGGKAVTAGTRAIRGVTKTKIWYHDVVPEKGSPLRFEPLPESEIAKIGGAKVEITKGGASLDVFGEIKEVKPFTAKEVKGIIETKSITGSKETVFISKGRETISITKESPSIVGKVLGKEEKIAVEKTKIIDTKPKIKENVRYFKEEGETLIEKSQFEREGIARGGLTKELIEQKETITRVPKEFTEVGKEIDFSVPAFVPTYYESPQPETPISEEAQKPKTESEPKSDVIEKSKPKTDIIPKVEPQNLEDVLNDVFTSIRTGTLTRSGTRQRTKQRTRQKTKNVGELRVPVFEPVIRSPKKPKKPKIPNLKDNLGFLGISKRKKGKVKIGFRLNIYASAKEIVKGLGIFKKKKGGKLVWEL